MDLMKYKLKTAGKSNLKSQTAELSFNNWLIENHSKWSPPYPPMNNLKKKKKKIRIVKF